MQDVGAEHFRAVRSVETGSWLGRAYQGRGLGREMREAILHLAFAGLDAEEALSGAFEDNAASLATSRAVGYEENGQARGHRRDSSGRTLRFRMGRDVWAQRRRDDIEIGLRTVHMFVGQRDLVDEYPAAERATLCQVAQQQEPSWSPGHPGGHVTVRASINPVVAVVFTRRRCVLYRLVLRVWLVELPIWGDEAIVGIMGRSIDGGHFTAFYLGQHYGGLSPTWWPWA
jgi:hypothetical protein